MGIGSDLSSLTGFQSKFIDHESLVIFVMNELRGAAKVVEYVQTGLRSGKDIYKQGGQIGGKYSDKRYSFLYDNKRCIIPHKNDYITKDATIVLDNDGDDTKEASSSSTKALDIVRSSLP